MADLDRGQVPDVAWAQAISRPAACPDRATGRAGTGTDTGTGAGQTRNTGGGGEGPAAQPDAGDADVAGQAAGTCAREARGAITRRSAASMVGGALRGPARWQALRRDCSRRLSRQRRSKPNKTRAAEEDRRAALRAHVAELTERQSTIVDQSRAKKKKKKKKKKKI